MVRQNEPSSLTAQVKAKAAQQRAEKAARDKAIAQVRNAKSEAKAKQAQVRQLIAQNDQRTKVGDDEAVPYNFVHGQKIKKIHVTKSAARSAEQWPPNCGEQQWHLSLCR